MIILAVNMDNALNALDKALGFLIPIFSVTLCIAAIILVLYLPVILYDKNNKKKTDLEREENRIYMEEVKFRFKKAEFNDHIALLEKETKELLQKKKKLIEDIEYLDDQKDQKESKTKKSKASSKGNQKEKDDSKSIIQNEGILTEINE